MPKWNQVVAIAIIVVLFILTGCLYLSQYVGEKAVLTDATALQPGSQKVYNLPPGFVNVGLTTDTPIDETFGGFGVSGEGHNVMTGSQGIGSVAGATYTVINHGSSPANINVRLTTGVLNPFRYI